MTDRKTELLAMPRAKLYELAAETVETMHDFELGPMENSELADLILFIESRQVEES
jgi:hypothetical protein